MGIYKTLFLLELRILVLYCTAEMLFIFFVIVDPNVVVIEINQWSLLV